MWCSGGVEMYMKCTWNETSNAIYWCFVYLISNEGFILSFWRNECNLPFFFILVKKTYFIRFTRWVKSFYFTIDSQNPGENSKFWNSAESSEIWKKSTILFFLINKHGSWTDISYPKYCKQLSTRLYRVGFNCFNPQIAVFSFNTLLPLSWHSKFPGKYT